MSVLAVGIFVNGLVAIVMIVWKRRVRATARNLARMLAAFLSLHMPGPDLTLDNPDLVKIPFGVAVAIAVILYSAGQVWGMT